MPTAKPIKMDPMYVDDIKGRPASKWFVEQFQITSPTLIFLDFNVWARFTDFNSTDPWVSDSPVDTSICIIVENNFN